MLAGMGVEEGETKGMSSSSLLLLSLWDFIQAIELGVEIKCRAASDIDHRGEQGDHIDAHRDAQRRNSA